jgi:hypothetical protein
MSSGAGTLDAGRTRPLDEARRRLAAAAGALERARPARVLAVFVAVQWLSVVALALTARHNGWVFYQGGDQLWYYTTGWLFAHGHVGQSQIGYLWSFLLAPIARVAGPNVANAYPAVILLDVLVLVPATTLALWGIAERIAGRVFAYWAAALWIALPFLGVEYANVGYHQRWTELFLPQALGLTAMADLPTTAAATVAAYFAARAIFDERPATTDALAAGLAAGAAVAIKPSTALFLLGPLLALAAARRFRLLVVGGAGLAPALLALLVWKWRGLGYLPFMHSTYDTVRLAAGAAVTPLAVSLNVGRYFNLDWHHLSLELDNVQEYFWSVRLVEWVVFAGAIGLARRSLRAALLVGGWFAAFVVVKGTYDPGSLVDASLLRHMLPSAPAFALLVAAVPLLLPRLPALARPRTEPGGGPSPRTRAVLLAAGALATAVVPLAAIAAMPRPPDEREVTLAGETPIPNSTDIGLRAVVSGGKVRLSWRPEHPAGGAVFYRILRTRAGTDSDFTCYDQVNPICTLRFREVGVTRAGGFVDAPPRGGRWTYRVGIAANWLNDPGYGDVYALSGPATAVAPGG